MNVHETKDSEQQESDNLEEISEFVKNIVHTLSISVHSKSLNTELHHHSTYTEADKVKISPKVTNSIE